MEIPKWLPKPMIAVSWEQLHHDFVSADECPNQYTPAFLHPRVLHGLERLTLNSLALWLSFVDVGVLCFNLKAYFYVGTHP